MTSFSSTARVQVCALTRFPSAGARRFPFDTLARCFVVTGGFAGPAAGAPG